MPAYRAIGDRAGHVNRTMGRDSRNAEAGALLERRVLRQGHDERERHNGEFGRCPEWTIRLRTVAPHAAAQPVRWNPVAEEIHVSRAIAVRDHAWIRHAVAEEVLPLLERRRRD